MAVGLPLKTTYADGDVYSASDVNDTNGTINTTAAPYAAGKNKIINGDFFVNQRGFTSTTADNTFTFDRWRTFKGGGGTSTYSAQTFTPGTAPVAGYEGKNFAQLITASQSAAGDYSLYVTLMEGVRTFAGQTATISFWAKAASGTPKIAAEMSQFFGTTGSPSADVNTPAGAVTISTSWARYSITVAVPSISGKTLGTSGNDYLGLFFWFSAGSTFNTRASSIGNQNNTFQIWGVQVEAGSTATAFQTATGTIQGELAACQRYYQAWSYYGTGTRFNNIMYTPMTFVVPMRIAPTMAKVANGDALGIATISSPSFADITAERAQMSFSTSGTDFLGTRTGLPFSASAEL